MNIFSISELTQRFKNQTLQLYDITMLWLLLNLEIFVQLFVYHIPVPNVKSFFLVDPQYKYEKEKLLEKIILSPEIQLQRFVKLYVIKSLLEKHNIEYFACGNTMLGCVRHNGFIPWDDSISLMILEEQCYNITEDFRMDLLYAGFQIKKTSEGFVITDFMENNFFVDMFIMRYIDNTKNIINYTSQILSEQFSDGLIQTNELFPLIDYNFGFFTLKGFNKPTNYFLKCDFIDYMKSACINKLYDKHNNDMLQEFFNKYNLKQLLIRDISLISFKHDVVYTDDWNQYFSRAKECIPSDFNSINYLKLNKDLKQDSDVIDVFIHYINIGKHEKRLYNIDSVLPLDFDIRGYKCLNPDLSQLSDIDLRVHYVTIGKNSKRQYNINSLLPFDFDTKTYLYLNPDLDGMTDEKLVYHYINIGKKEKRFYVMDGIVPTDFNYEHYLQLNPDLHITTQRDAIIHYVLVGRNENRKYK